MDTPIDAAVPVISTLTPAKNAPKNMPTCFTMGKNDRTGRTYEQGIRFLEKEIRRNGRKHRASSKECYWAAGKSAEMVLAHVQAMNGGDPKKTKEVLKAKPFDMLAAILAAREELGFTGELVPDSPAGDEDAVSDADLDDLDEADIDE